MQAGDKLEGQLQALKASSSNVSNDVGSSSYTPFFKERTKDSKRLRRHLIKKLENKEFDSLVEEFKEENYSEQFVNDFFEREYYGVFNWLIMECEDDGCFKLILKLFQKEVLKNQLEKENFRIVSEFFISRSAIRGLGLKADSIQRLIQLDKERFKFLLEIDSEGIQSFMKRNENAYFMKSSILEDYKGALQSFSSEKEVSSSQTEAVGKAISGPHRGF